MAQADRLDGIALKSFVSAWKVILLGIGYWGLSIVIAGENSFFPAFQWPIPNIQRLRAMSAADLSNGQ
jgi:hypothetical protein